MSTETNQRLLATLQMSRDYANSARSLPVAEGAFCQAFFGGTMLLYKVAELPDAAHEGPRTRAADLGFETAVALSRR